MSKATLEDIVEAVVRERFSSHSVQSVRVTKDVDDDGDEILKVLIVMRDSFGATDEQKVLGLVRHLRSALAERGTSGFPIIDFMSSADAAKMKPETA